MKHLILRFLTILLFLFLKTSPAFSAPVITGISRKHVWHNRSVTITGNDFGTKRGGAAPIRFDTFEDGETGESLAGGWWKIKGNDQDITYDKTIPTRHRFSKKQVRWKKNKKIKDAGHVREWFYKDKLGFAKTGKAYVNLWLSINFLEVSGYVKSKWWLYLINLLPDHGQNPSYSLSFWSRDKRSVTWTRNIVVDSKGNTRHLKGENFLPEENYWMNIAIEYKDSDAGKKNGEASLYNSQTPFYSGKYGKSKIKNYVTRALDTDKFVNALRLGQYVDLSPDYSIETYWDDIYIDNSWARVEIGNRQVYNECTHREIQVPSSWSKNSITVTVKQGSFKKSDKVYLFVVDENGTPGKGRFIKFIHPSESAQ